MQSVTRQDLLDTALEKLADGTVSHVLGWSRGTFDYEATPTLFSDPDTLRTAFVWNDFCGANLSKYLIKHTRRLEGRLLVFLKPCDTYSFNQLLTEHRFERERVFVVGVPCNGMADPRKLKAQADGILSVTAEGDTLSVETLYDGTRTLAVADLLEERCLTCKSRRHAAYDLLLGEEGEVQDSARFDEVAAIEAMSPDERFAFWQKELSRCIRCNACRDVCPACTCEQCVFGNPSSGVENKAASNEFEEKLFHIIRALHVAGRCTDCGECSRVCPQGIPLHLLNRKFIKEINENYGVYQAGAEVGTRAPLVDFTLDDPEAETVVRRGDDA
ncbi:MAG: 4Fe-4S dicluster domain-containing protein [Clostridia bacterium]|nr:4Fe-4S dicluster domain-containing protein [Clostridia bacterium]